MARVLGSVRCESGAERKRERDVFIRLCADILPHEKQASSIITQTLSQTRPQLSTTHQPTFTTTTTPTMSSTSRAPTENQLSPLHGPHVLITSHNDQGKAIVKESEPVKVTKTAPPPPTMKCNHSSHPLPQWVTYDEDKLSMSVLWTTQFPTDVNNDADIKLHRERMAEGATGLALGGGTVLRYVEFAPGYEASRD